MTTHQDELIVKRVYDIVRSVCDNAHGNIAGESVEILWNCDASQLVQDFQRIGRLRE